MSNNGELQKFEPYRHAILFAFVFSFTLVPEYHVLSHEQLIENFFLQDEKDTFLVPTTVFAYNIHKGFQFDKECKMFLQCVQRIAENLDEAVGFGLTEKSGFEYFFAEKIDQ